MCRRRAECDLPLRRAVRRPHPVSYTHLGRAKLAVSDWDGDGVWDLLWGHNLGVYREIWPKHLSRPKGAVPCLFRNVGSNAAPRFGGLQELEQADGERFQDVYKRQSGCSGAISRGV